MNTKDYFPSLSLLLSGEASLLIWAIAEDPGIFFFLIYSLFPRLFQYYPEAVLKLLASFSAYGLERHNFTWRWTFLSRMDFTGRMGFTSARTFSQLYLLNLSHFVVCSSKSPNAAFLPALLGNGAFKLCREICYFFSKVILRYLEKLGVVYFVASARGCFRLVHKEPISDLWIPSDTNRLLSGNVQPSALVPEAQVL